MSTSLSFKEDDLSGADVRALITLHLKRMHENSPAESVHALGIDKLRDPKVRFWSAWTEGQLAGCGALKKLSDSRGEIKSMRVSDAFLGQGIGRAILNHIISIAREQGMESLWLETGSAPAFAPAICLYESHGFQRCGPFADYREDAFSVFMTRLI